MEEIRLTTWDVENPYQPQLVSRISSINRMFFHIHKSFLKSISLMSFVVDPKTIVINGVKWGPINGRNQMGNWGLTFLIGAITPGKPIYKAIYRSYNSIYT